jgi:predicted kinase
MKVIITVGLPASGKSTWAKDWCIKNPQWVRVSRDDLRNMRGKYWLPKDEDLITDWEKTAIMMALSRGKNVIVDATNLNPKYRKELIHMIKDLEEHEPIQIEEKLFDVSPEECIKRDAKRGEASVGPDVIWGMYYKYIAPIPVYKEDWNLTHCIIVDIDGTLANSEHRKPYDWDKVGDDKLIEFVHQAVCHYKAYDEGFQEVIIVSGRDGGCYGITHDWLEKMEVPFSHLYMRAAGDKRKDSIVKKELFEAHIRGKYYVDYVIDDRDQVVRMWRNELGLNVFQCNYGNF